MSTGLGQVQFSNKSNALNFADDDFKLLVIETPKHYIGGAKTLAETRDFFTRLCSWLRGEEEGMTKYQGAAEVYQFLLDRDVSAFNAGQLPVTTQAYENMARAGMKDYQTPWSR